MLACSLKGCDGYCLYLQNHNSNYLFVQQPTRNDVIFANPQWFYIVKHTTASLRSNSKILTFFKETAYSPDRLNGNNWKVIVCLAGWSSCRYFNKSVANVVQEKHHVLGTEWLQLKLYAVCVHCDLSMHIVLLVYTYAPSLVIDYIM